MKNCINCGIERPLTDYYKHKAMNDGRLGACKECVKKRSHARLLEKSKDPEWVEKEKERHREKYHRLSDHWKQPSKEKRLGYRQKWDNKFPEKKKAISLSQHIKCPKGMEKHHWSYAIENAKDVLILAKNAHYFFHRYHEYHQNQMVYKNKKGRIMTKMRTAEFLVMNGF